MPNQILVTAPHPDDEILGCAGAIAHHARLGDEVTVLVFTDGVGGRKSAVSSDIATRAQRRKKSHQILGVGHGIQLDFPDNQLDTVPLLNLAQSIEDVAAGKNFRTVYCPFNDDLNVDHRQVHEATLIAFRPIYQTKTTILSYPIASSTEWSPRTAFRPSIFLDISKYLDIKVRAMEAYAEECRPFPHPRSPEAIIATATYWGSVSGLRAAEPFQAVRVYL